MAIGAVVQAVIGDRDSNAAGLMADPYPDDARPDPDIPQTDILERGHLRLFHRVVQADVDEVDVVGVRSTWRRSGRARHGRQGRAPLDEQAEAPCRPEAGVRCRLVVLS
ncbi:hypothetical protein ACFVH6_37450 [Spirillospora sp. NPDC127200]